MGLLNNCAVSFNNLTNYMYHFVIGRKGKSVEFDLLFEKSDFHHLAGLHKLRDNDAIRTSDREQIFNEILQNHITEDKLMKSDFYEEVAGRLPSLSILEQLLDSNELVFHFSNKANPTTKINADYVLKCNDENGVGTVFVFIIDKNGSMRCVSQFPMTNKDYSQFQTKYTLLLKEKIDIKSGKVILSYQNPSYKQ